MINFSIFTFIIFAVWDAAGQIVFGSARRNVRAHRRRRRKRQHVRLYAIQKQTKTARRQKSLRAVVLLYYGSCATIAWEPSSLKRCSASFFSKCDTLPATESAIR